MLLSSDLGKVNVKERGMRTVVKARAIQNFVTIVVGAEPISVSTSPATIHFQDRWRLTDRFR